MNAKQYSTKATKALKAAQTLRADMCKILDFLEDEYPYSSSASNVLHAIRQMNEVIDTLELEAPQTGK